MTPTTTRPELPAYCDPDKPFVDLIPRDGGQAPGVLTWFPAATDTGHLAGFVRLDVDRDRTLYAVSEYPADWPGRAFVFAKPVSGSGTDKGAESYAVYCEADATQDKPLGSRCECRGFLRHRKPCKHLLCALGLIANHWL